jgi:hypothetical protein
MAAHLLSEIAQLHNLVAILMREIAYQDSALIALKHLLAIHR